MSDYTGEERRTDCLHCSGVQEQIRCLKENDTMQWKKIDELIGAIGTGKNWIIGVLVAIVTNIAITLMKL